MFENFIACKKVFILEQQVIEGLRQFKLMLIMKKESLLRCGNKTTSHKISTLLGRCSYGMKSLTRKLTRNYKKCKKDEAIKQSSHIFPKQYDFEGAVKAVVILYNTYNFDLTKTRSYSFIYRSSSEISYIDFQNTPHLVSFPSAESLVHDDFILLSHRAGYFYHFYDTAIYLIKEALDSFNEYTSSSMLFDYLLEMRTNLTETHNNFLLGTHKRIGKNHKVAPYLFSDTLQPIKENIDWKGDYVIIEVQCISRSKSLTFLNLIK